MPKKLPLTNTAILKAQPGDKPLKLFDGGGLFLLIKPSGGKWWRLKYRYLKREKLLSLGTYPEVSLKEAREKRDFARKQLAAEIDPGANRKAVKVSRIDSDGNSLEIISREWLNKKSYVWSQSHTDKIIRRLERDVFPWIGKRPISEITPPELLGVLRRIEERGVPETAHRALQNFGQVLRYAIATGRATYNIAGDLRGALMPIKEGHFAAITDPEEVGSLLRAISSYKGSVVTKCAMRLAPLVFLRPGELRQAEWVEINLEKAEWIIPAARMKLKNQGDHLVPLSRQAIEILKELHPVTGEGRYVFPGARSGSRPMSDNAILAAMRRMDIPKEQMTGHGFRAMARTILDEVLHIRPDYIEHQLAHAVRDPNGRAYNRTAHLPERRKMMQKWADYLDTIKLTHSNSRAKL
jgi:integrase